MAAYICKACGDTVWAEPGREMRTVSAHAREAGHPNRGLTHPASKVVAAQRRAGGRRPPQPERRSWGTRWRGLPLSARVIAVLCLLALALTYGLWLADTGKDPDPYCTANAQRHGMC